MDDAVFRFKTNFQRAAIRTPGPVRRSIGCIMPETLLLSQDAPTFPAHDVPLVALVAIQGAEKRTRRDKRIRPRRMNVERAPGPGHGAMARH